jgi:hypothetical protein
METGECSNAPERVLMLVRGGQGTTRKIGRSEEGERAVCVWGMLVVFGYYAHCPQSAWTYTPHPTPIAKCKKERREPHASVSVLCLSSVSELLDRCS